MKIVLDTNVLISGLLNPRGIPGRILDLISGGHLAVLYDDRILAEYRDVVARPRLRIEPADGALIIDGIANSGFLLPAPPLDVELPDPMDLPFLEVAEAGHVSALVTGNGRHFIPVRGHVTVPVLTPAEFFELWQQSRRYPSFD